MLPNDTPPSGGLYLIWLSDEDEPHYYGGRTTCYKRRWRDHETALLGGRHKNAHMQATFNKYGVFRVEAVPTDGDITEAEQAWLDEHYGKPRCVNLSPHAVGGNIVEWTPERRRRRSERYTGNVSHTEETRQRMSETRSTRPDLVEKARRSLARNRLPKGYTPTPEHRANNAAAQRGKKHTPEHIEKRAAAHRGRKNTPETIAKMSESAKRRAAEQPTEHGPETRALISRQQTGRVCLTRGGENTRVKSEDVDALLAEGWERGVTHRDDLVRIKQAWVTDGNEIRRVPESEVERLLADGWERGRVPSSERKLPTYTYQKVENPKSNHKGTVWVRRRDPDARGGWEARRLPMSKAASLLAEGWERGMRPLTRPSVGQRLIPGLGVEGT